MKKILLFLVLSLSTWLNVLAQETLLYKVEHKGWKKASYVFGTMHVNDEKAFAFGDPVFDAIDASDKVAFEISMLREDHEDQMENLIESEEAKNLMNFLRDTFMVRLKAADIDMKELETKILLISKELEQFLKDFHDPDSFRNLHVDAFLEMYARKKGKPTIGIETIEEQLKYLMSFDRNQLTENAIAFLKKPDWEKSLLQYLSGSDELKSQYSGIQMDQICGTVDGLAQSNWIDLLINKRNEIMVDRMYSEMGKQGVFMAIGAAHLCGEKGILALLKQKGCKLTPIKLGAKSEEIFIWKQIGGSDRKYTVDIPSHLEMTEDWYNPGVSTADTTRSGMYQLRIYQTTDPNYNDEVVYGDDHVGEAIFEGNTDEVPEQEEMPTKTIHEEQIQAPVEEIISDIPMEEYEIGQEVVADVDELDMGSDTIVETPDWSSLLGSWHRGNKKVVDTLVIEGAEGSLKLETLRAFQYISIETRIPIPESNGAYWVLELSGDSEMVRNQDLYRFFTSFKMLP